MRGTFLQTVSASSLGSAVMAIDWGADGNSFACVWANHRIGVADVRMTTGADACSLTFRNAVQDNLVVRERGDGGARTGPR